ncbi:MAG: DUF819 family protein [Pirellulales bacterium]|nr:DUF819 family protein [Pirellulales bacterium]
MDQALISSEAGVLAVLTGICAFFFWLEKATRWRLFQYVPPLVFIYLTPVLLSNTGVLVQWMGVDREAPSSPAAGVVAMTPAGVIPTSSPAYDAIKAFALPMMLVLMLLNVDVGRAVRLVGRGVGVMLFGSVGVIVGAALGTLAVRQWLEPNAWKAYGALAGSWVGGTGNLAAVSEALDASGTEVGLAVLADTLLLLLWVPVMLASKRIAAPFARFARVDEDRVAAMDAAILADEREAPSATYQEYLYLLFAAFAVTAVSQFITQSITEFLTARKFVWPVHFSESTCRILLVTTIGIALSFTPLRRIVASRHLGMALVFLFMAQTGATANLAMAAEQAAPFLGGALICIATHGAFCLLGARLLRVDIHTAAIASAANIGGIATASCVAAHHKESLMPAAILLALLGYALGNYAGLMTAALCRMAM